MLNKDDLSINIENTRLNIRVVILLETPEGVVFEKSRFGYYFPLGGRIKINEATDEAAIREVKEEINRDICKQDLKLVGLIENFFVLNGMERFHELSFVYSVSISESIDTKNINSEGDNQGYRIISKEELPSYDVRPNVISEILNSNSEFEHIINNEI